MTCKAILSEPRTNFKSGHLYWVDRPCRVAAERNGYCVWHQDQAIEEQGMSKAVMDAYNKRKTNP